MNLALTSSLPGDNFVMTAQEGGTPEESSSPAGLRKQRSEFGVAKANGASGAGGQGGGSHTGGAQRSAWVWIYSLGLP